MRALARRIARAEAACARPEAAAPHVVNVGSLGRAAALAVLDAFPDRARNHSVLVVPAKAATDAERQRFADRFKASQTALVAAARSEKSTPLIAEPDAERVTEKKQLAQVTNVITAAKTPLKTPTFSAANFSTRTLRERIAARRLEDQ